MSEWRVVRLGDLFNVKSSKRIYASEYVEDGVPFYRSREIIEIRKNKKIISPLYISESRYKELAERHGAPKKGDILITSVGTIGTVWFVEQDKFYFKDGNLNWIESNIDEVTGEFIYYWLDSSVGYNNIINQTIGTSQSALTLQALKKLKIYIPNKITMEKISNVLSTYDNLIENNNRRIQILEQTAEELYKEWFVRMRFPGYEKTKFDKGIPEGWEVKKVKGLVKRYRYGSLYKENDVMQEGNVIVIDQSEKDFLGFHNNEPDHFAGIDNPIILFGDHSCKMLIMTSPFSLSENVIPFNAENNLNTLFLFYAIRDLVHTTEYKRHWSDLTNKRILVPDYSLQQKFEAKVKSIIILINEYKKSNLNLIKQRDLLLPRLMNGTITVK